MAPKQQSPKEYEEEGNGKTDNEFQCFSTKIRVRCSNASASKPGWCLSFSLFNESMLSLWNEITSFLKCGFPPLTSSLGGQC